MEWEQNSQEAWLAATINELRQAGSWTGRIHVHKLLYATQALGLAQPPFRFVFHHFGPFSRELDETFGEMELFGGVKKEYPSPNYGPKYGLTEGVETRLSEDNVHAIRRVAGLLGDKGSADLELIGTLLWVSRNEGIDTSDERIVTRVHELKPKYDEQSIRDRLAAVSELERLAAAE